MRLLRIKCLCDFVSGMKVQKNCILCGLFIKNVYPFAGLSVRSVFAPRPLTFERNGDYSMTVISSFTKNSTTSSTVVDPSISRPSVSTSENTQCILVYLSYLTLPLTSTTMRVLLYKVAVFKHYCQFMKENLMRKIGSNIITWCNIVKVKNYICSMLLINCLVFLCVVVDQQWVTDDLLWEYFQAQLTT